MPETLDKLARKVCESLPLNLTLLEKDGLCSKQETNCKYCKTDVKQTYLCTKNTYIPLDSPRATLPA